MLLPSVAVQHGLIKAGPWQDLAEGDGLTAAKMAAVDTAMKTQIAEEAKEAKEALAAVEKATEIGVLTIGLIGRDGGLLKDLCDVAVVVPSEITARIQEMHLLIGHSWCETVDAMTNE